jgi:DNA-binding winged helix-turn-helix (wHTH) protein
MSDMTDDTQFDVNDLKIDLKHKRVECKGKNIYLSPPLFRMLACLHSAFPDLVERGKIFDAVWGHKKEGAGETNFDKARTRLNKKLFPHRLEIRNEPRLGYRLAKIRENGAPAKERSGPEVREGVQRAAAIKTTLGDVLEAGTAIDKNEGESTMLGAVEASSPPAIFRTRDSSRSFIFTRDELNYTFGSVEYRLDKATRDIWISGNDNNLITHSLSGFVENALKDGRTIRLLGAAPTRAIVSMLSKIDPRFKERDFKKEVDKSTAVALKWQAKYPNFEYRLLPILPAIGYFITDPNLPSRTVKIELYTPDPWGPLKSRPHIVIDESLPEWRDYFIKQFENYWNLSKTP